MVQRASYPEGVPPTTVGGGGVVAGRVAVLRDPAGAFFGFWEAGLNTGAEEVNAPGTLLWNELHTPDLPGARAFYAGVVGVDFQSYDDGSGGPEYAIFSAGDHMAGGMTVSDAVPPHWRVYFGTADTDATVARAVELGGTVADPAVDTPQGRVANLLDPHGGAFSVISVAPEE
jgi:predicted enzyme related to lactoylglutathione lyase